MSTEAVPFTKLFVGQIPRHLSENELKAIYEPFGEISDLVILRDRSTGQSRGCGFVTYSTKEAADKAIAETNEKTQVGGRTLQTRYANKPGEQHMEPNADGQWKVFVGMLDRNSNEAAVEALFNNYGKVLEVFLMVDKATGGYKGCGFVKYAEKEEALSAISNLHGKYTDGSAPKALVVRMADTEQQKQQRRQVRLGGGNMNPMMMMMQQQRMMGMGGGWGGPHQQRMFPYNQGQRFNNNNQGGEGGSRGPPDANLFLYGIPDVWSDHDLLQLCSPFGMVISSSVYRDRETGTSKGFGFVSYDNAVSAQTAIMNLNGLMIGSKRLKVEIKTQRNGGNFRGGQQQQYQQQQQAPAMQQPGSLQQHLLDPLQQQAQQATPGQYAQGGQAHYQQQYTQQYAQSQGAAVPQQAPQFNQQQQQLYGQQGQAGQQAQGQQAQGHTLFPGGYNF